jgi:hypothetical protein
MPSLLPRILSWGRLLLAGWWSLVVAGVTPVLCLCRSCRDQATFGDTAVGGILSSSSGSGSPRWRSLMDLHGASAGSFPCRSLVCFRRSSRILHPTRRPPILRFSLAECCRPSRDMPASQPTRLAIVTPLTANARLLGTCPLGARAEAPLVHTPHRRVQSVLAPRSYVATAAVA